MAVMRETYQLRVVEEFAHLLFSPHEGKPLGLVRLVHVPATDSRVGEIARLQIELSRTQGRPFFYGWDIRRQYSRRELVEAELFRFQVTSAFEPTGEQCGTLYNDSASCAICGADAPQLSDLRLNLSRIPRVRSVSRTIGGEVVILNSLAELLMRHGVSPAHFRPVRDHENDKVSNAWSQLSIPDARLDVGVGTLCGNELFAAEEESKTYRCSFGHVLGLAVLSEVQAARASYGGEDFAASNQFVGVRRGLLRPERLLFISPRIWQILDQEQPRGVRIEVAHLV